MSRGRCLYRPCGKQCDHNRLPAKTYSVLLQIVGGGVLDAPASSSSITTGLMQIRTAVSPHQSATLTASPQGEAPPLRGGRRTDCHTSDIGHWFAMTYRGRGTFTGRFRRKRTAAVPHPPRPHKLHIACFRVRPKSALIPLLVLSPPKPLTLGFGVAPFYGPPSPRGRFRVCPFAEKTGPAEPVLSQLHEITWEEEASWVRPQGRRPWEACREEAPSSWPRSRPSGSRPAGRSRSLPQAVRPPAHRR